MGEIDSKPYPPQELLNSLAYQTRCIPLSNRGRASRVLNWIRQPTDRHRIKGLIRSKGPYTQFADGVANHSHGIRRDKFQQTSQPCPNSCMNPGSPA